MNKDLEEFLLNSNANDQVFSKSFGEMKIHKESYDNRFTVLYIKDYSDHLGQNDYVVAGYYDVIDKCIYDCHYWIADMFAKESSIKLGSFSKLGEKMSDDVKEYIRKYSFNNEETLKKNAKEEYLSKDHKYTIDRLHDTVNELFITEETPTISLEVPYLNYGIHNEKYYKDIYLSYLNEPEKTIKEYAELVIKNHEKDLGINLLKYYDKLDYLEELKDNKDNKYDYIHINKNIYNSIKDSNAKTLTITITYGGKDLKFKYEYYRLKSDLMRNDKGSGGYGVGYEVVSNFIKENSPEIEENRYSVDFLFSHIKSITYGKNELYHHDVDSPEISHDEEDLEIEI